MSEPIGRDTGGTSQRRGVYGDPWRDVNERSRSAAISRSYAQEIVDEPETAGDAPSSTYVSPTRAWLERERARTAQIAVETATERRSRGIIYAVGAITLWASAVILGAAAGLYALGSDPAGTLGVIGFAAIAILVLWDVLQRVGTSELG